MNAENVASLACGTTMPPRGHEGVVVCSRQRHHAADHYGRDETTGRTHTWPDPPYAPPGKAPMVPADPPAWSLYPDRQTREQLERAADARGRERHIGGGFWAIAAVLELVGLIILVCCAPAIIHAVWAWGF